MTGALWLDNLWTWSLQLTLVILVGSASLWAMRVRNPRVLLAARQTLLGVCLVLPLVQPWRVPVPAFTAGAPEVLASGVSDSVAAGMSGWWMVQGVWWVLVSGVVARAAWLVLGLLRLGGYVRQAESYSGSPHEDRLSWESPGGRSPILVSDRVAGPVALGWRPGVVLVPPTLLTMEPAQRIAVLCHELLHLRRRDWLWTLAEECVRSLFWFHPIMRLLIRSIQSTREEVVDREVVRITGDRDSYIRALLETANHSAASSPAPAFAFSRRGSLSHRIMLLTKEVSMSPKKTVVSVAVCIVGVLLASGLAVESFPLTAGSLQPHRVSGSEAAPHRLSQISPAYPAQAKEQGIQGVVLLEAFVDRSGEVADARVIQGPMQLRKSALQEVLQWRYSTQLGLPALVEVVLHYRLDP